MTVLEAYTISRYFQWAGSLAIAVSCLYHFRQRPVYIKVLGFYAVASILFSLLQEISIQFFSNVGLNSIGNGSVLSEALLLSTIFFYVTEDTLLKRVILFLIILYSLFYLSTFLFFESRSYSYIRFGRDSLMIINALHYFFYLIRRLPEDNLSRFPMFWINAAIIFFFSGTFILSLGVDYIVSVLKDDLSGFWAFRNFFRFAFCLVLSYAGWLDWRLQRSKEFS